MTYAPARTRGEDRTFCQIGDGAYQLTIASLGLQYTIDRLRRERHELIGELAVGCDLKGARTVDGMLSIADWNLSSAQGRSTRAKLLAERADAPDIDFTSHLEELAQRTIIAERNGAPAKPLHTYERPGPESVYEIDGLRLLRDHPTIMFGDGGSLKSYLALYVAGTLSIRGVPVLYADWELGGADHRERLQRLFGEDMPLVHYLRCDRALTHEADRIHREARRLAIDYWIADSIGFATAGPPEAAEHATAYFRAVRAMGIGSLHLAHISRAENGDQKPFGSSFWHNSARATWFVKQAAASPDAQNLTIGLFNRKSNITRQYPATGFNVTFSETSTVITRANLAEVDDLAPALPLWQRIHHLLRGGPRTVEQIADELKAKAETVRRTIDPKRARKGIPMFALVPGTDGETRVSLVERRAS